MRIVHDTRLIFGRYLRQTLRNKIALIFGALQPLLYLGLFGPLLTQMPGMSRLYGGAGIWQGFVPGMLVMLALFGGMFVGFGIIGESRQGVVERLRVTPASRLALLLGRIGNDVVKLEFQSVLLLLVAVALGLRAPLAGIAIGLVMVAMLGASLAALSYAIGLLTKSEDAFAPLVSAVILPLTLLSGILLPMSMAPGWLNALAHVNPFFYVVAGMRDAFAGQYLTASLGIGLAVAVALTAISLTAGALTFRRENA